MNKEDKDFVVNRDYLTSDDFEKGTFVGSTLKGMEKVDKNFPINREINRAHTPQRAKSGATKINQAIHNTMMDYLC